MRVINNKKWSGVAAVLFLSATLLLGGCASITPVNNQPRPTVPATPAPAVKEYKIVYNYGDTDKVQLSANNIALQVGQKLVIEPAPGLAKSTRFTSSGEYFIGDIMKQETQESSKVVFVATTPGKGKLQVIPNNTELDRAVDLWITVQ